MGHKGESNLTLWHLMLSSTIDITSALIIVPVTINGSKGTITTRTSNGNTQHKLVFDPCGSVKCAGKCMLRQSEGQATGSLLLSAVNGWGEHPRGENFLF